MKNAPSQVANVDLTVVASSRHFLKDDNISVLRNVELQFQGYHPAAMVYIRVYNGEMR